METWRQISRSSMDNYHQLSEYKPIFTQIDTILFLVVFLQRYLVQKSWNNVDSKEGFTVLFYCQGTKRKAVSGYQSHDDSSDNSECSFPFKYSYGVNAWKHWVKTRQLDEDLLVLDELKSCKCFLFCYHKFCIKICFL